MSGENLGIVIAIAGGVGLVIACVLLAIRSEMKNGNSSFDGSSPPMGDDGLSGGRPDSDGDGGDAGGDSGCSGCSGCGGCGGD